ncbi:hypothetical protein [Priestia endophytica]|uniref:hypothetical protein n=1 Tax=Priestia endophytica TaxID=135735 RepID=UPI002280884B|nr:hypothetical protein [Priestia endophytica]MCY8233451.1 hypothetical protein [Priestia endophytica]
MRYMALVKKLDPIIEEEVTLQVEGVEFTGFSFICPYQIEEGKVYPVLIGFTILDELVINEIEDKEKGLKRINSGYEYCIRGTLNEDSIDAGIVLSDEDEYFLDYPELQGKNVEIKVDRISIEFLRD